MTHGDREWLTKSPALRGMLAGTLTLVVLAVAVRTIGSGKYADGASAMLAGSALVIVISAVFYAVGLSEDRDRAGGE